MDSNFLAVHEEAGERKPRVEASKCEAVKLYFCSVSAKTHSVPIGSSPETVMVCFGLWADGFSKLDAPKLLRLSCVQSYGGHERQLCSQGDAKVGMERDILALKCNVEDDEREQRLAPPSLSLPQGVSLYVDVASL